MTTKTRNLKPGDRVTLNGLPPGFIDNLPEEDQRALLDAIGKWVGFNEYREDGKAELEFTDKRDVIHFIYVDPKFVTPIKRIVIPRRRA